MPPPSPRSNIRAFVQWRESSVHAGEEIECIITFKNVAQLPEDVREQHNGFPAIQPNAFRRSPSVAQTVGPSTTQGRPATGRTLSITSARNVSQGRNHRPTMSLNVFNASSRNGPQSAPLQARASGTVALTKGHGHGRSLSIMSLGSEALSDRRTPTSIAATRKPSKGHSRSSSLQVLPKSTTQASPSYLNQPMSAVPGRQSSPLHDATTPPILAEDRGEQLPIRPIRRKPGVVSAGNTPQLGRNSSFPRIPSSGTATPEFEFPPRQPQGAKRPSPQPEAPRPSRSPHNMHSAPPRTHSPRPVDGWTGNLGSLNPISRVISESSAPGTPRSSAEFYSMSNGSDETLTSEAPVQDQMPDSRMPPPPRPSKNPTQNTGFARPPEPETLMMGYVRTNGRFTLDGSLVNSAPFEEVKRKGVQGGGGVIGVERPKRSSGVFGGFSWGSIGESLGGLLGSNEMSSIAQMKASAGSRSVPLLSTPQSLLFVDLTLAPGESKSYGYRFALPKGLPPSYKGRAIKVEYTLSIGVQRPEGQAIKFINIPFRVLGSVSSRGEMLGHDLMSPYIMLQDAARTTSINSEPGPTGTIPPFPSQAVNDTLRAPKKGLEDFLRYTERLLDAPKDSNGVLASPTEPLSPTISRASSIFDQMPSSTKEAIDFAIMRSNQIDRSGKQSAVEAQSANSFNIARSGQPIAVLTILRPAYRLGESLIGTIDFSAPSSIISQIPTYSVLVDLESTERVDPSLALRSAASIHRATRRVYSSTRENSLFARKVSFSLAIPSTATPSFDTTGVSLAWSLRVEFTTMRQGRGVVADGERGEDELLEELGSDDRGVNLIAKQQLIAETFDIAVPLKIFGAMGVDALGEKAEPLEI